MSSGSPAQSPGGSRGGEAELRVKLQSADGRGVRRITEVEAAEIIATGLGYQRRRGEVWLIDQASSSRGTSRTWLGAAKPGDPRGYDHDRRVCREWPHLET